MAGKRGIEKDVISRQGAKGVERLPVWLQKSAF